MLLTLHIILMLLVMPWEPTPLSRKPCSWGLLLGLLGALFFLHYNFFYRMDTQKKDTDVKRVLPLTTSQDPYSWVWIKERIIVREWAHTWKGKWSGPRPGAELIWIVPDSMASLTSIALSKSLVNTQPCNYKNMRSALPVNESVNAGPCGILLARK